MKKYTKEEIDKIYRELNIADNLSQFNVEKPETEVRIVNY